MSRASLRRKSFAAERSTDLPGIDLDCSKRLAKSPHERCATPRPFLWDVLYGGHHEGTSKQRLHGLEFPALCQAANRGTGGEPLTARDCQPTETLDERRQRREKSGRSSQGTELEFSELPQF